jgi:signal transduction histidine kinase
VADDTTYAARVAERVAGAQRDLARRWLACLVDLLPVEARDVFPSDQLLDHIPALIEEIATYLRAPDEEELAANTTVIVKAQQLGELRHSQQASVHQILREYALLGSVLEEFVADLTRGLDPPPAPRECLDVVHRLGRAVQTLMQVTVDTFVAAYSATITRQTEQLAGFNRMVSHELRNPLGTVHHAVGVLARAPDADLVAVRPRLVTLLQRNLGRITELLRSLESLTRAQVATNAPSVQVVEIRAVAAEAARQLAEMADARGVTIKIADDLPTTSTDPARLELALLNLLSNAIKYSDPAKADRWVEIIADPSQAEGRFTLMVRDNGLGMPSDALPDLLHRPFHRLHAHLDQELGVDGTGLGLSIVQECVAAVGGEVGVSSEEGAGTTVRLVFPLA